jgi:6-phosphogluconolactonase/glucosamine-6-phosphate isomerase/deaminase
VPVLKLGVARTNITPPEPVSLAGFEHRRGVSAGVSHPLYARVLLFEEGEGSSKRRALLVSADLIWWGEDQVESLRRCLEERWDIRRSCVILHATHNHSGPQTSGRFSLRLGRPDPAYLETLVSRVLAAVVEASGRLETVTVEQGRDECRIGVNRRRCVAGRIEMAPNEAGPADPEVTVIRFRTPSSTTKAVLVHHACHPTTTEGELISSEFPGVAMELVEGELGGGAVAAYLQGCCGDVRPALVRNGQFYWGGDAEVRKLGERLGTEALSVMQRPMRRLSPSLLSGRQTTIPLPLQELPDRAGLEASSRRSDVVGEWGTLLLREPRRLQQWVPLEITLLNLAGGLSFLAMNGEVVVEYGLFVKRRFAGRVLPLPYSNGMVGYVPTARQVGEGGYEARESIFYFGLPAPFASSLEREIHNGLTELVEEGDLNIRPEPLKTETVDRLTVRVYEDREAMGSAAGADVAEKVRELLSQKERVRMVFAAAPSQSEALRALAGEAGIDWSRVTAFHMDEYVGLSRDAPQSFGRFLSDALFDVVKPGETHFIDGTGPPAEECERYAALIRAAPIDIVCLGVGENGHVAFNDPPVADFDDPEVMKPVQLDEASRRQQVNDCLFSSVEEVPTHALTLTIPALMSGTHLFCVVPGPTKRSAVEHALRGPVTTECPASVLRRHPHCVLYVDVDAYGYQDSA